MVVGAGGYESHPKLDYAALDATEFAGELVTSLGFDRQRMLVLADHPSDGPDYRPTRRDIFHSLGMLGNTHSEFYLDRKLEPMGEDDLFVFYFSGHGIRHESAEFLLPVETSKYSVTDTAVPLDAIVAQIAALPCPHKILFLDACREQLYQDEGAKAAGGAKGIGGTNVVVDREGLATFYSCDPGQRSYEIEKLRHGSFTFCLLEAIRHPDVNTLGELDRYLKSRVPKANAIGNKEPQQPFLVPNPADMLDLTLFQLANLLSESDQLIAMTNELYDRGRLDKDWWDKLYRVWDSGDAPSLKLKRLIFEMFHREELEFEDFERRWRRTETTLPIGSRKPDLPGREAAGARDDGEPAGIGAEGGG